MYICFLCNQTLVTPEIDVDRSLILKKLRWESGPASVQHPEEIALVLEKVHLDIESCESEIHHLECSGCKAVWTTYREVLRTYAGEVQSLLSPVRMIPDEILQSIFDHCCEINRFMLPNHHSNLGDTPASALSSVSFRWRRNGLSMPILWSRILVELKQEPQQRRRIMENEKLFLALDLFLNRSQPLPLDLTVRLLRDALSYLSYGETHPILTRLMDHTHRWYSFSYQSQHYILPNVFLKPLASVKSNFPVLEDLEIRDAAAVELAWFTDMAPKLKCLRLLGSVGLDAMEDGLPVFFDGHPTLTSLTIEEETPRYDIPMPVTSSSLKTLFIGHGHNQSYNDMWPEQSVFEFLNLPVLQNLHLRPSLHFIPNSASTNWVNFDPFMGFVKRSSFLLTTLSIQSLALSNSQLRTVLINVPTLLKLTLDDTNVPTENSPITADFVASLNTTYPDTVTTPPRLAPIVSKLRALTLNVGASSFDDALVVDMVLSRCIPHEHYTSQSDGNSMPLVDCLRDFAIRFRNREEVKGVYDPLERMKKNGMRVAVLWEV